MKVSSKPFLTKDRFLKRYQVQPLASLNEVEHQHDLHNLVEYFSELFSKESHEPENFKKLVAEPDEMIFNSIHPHPPPSTKFKFKSSEKTTLYSPFEATNLAQGKSNEKLWYYLDEEHQVNGPHSTRDMDDWFNHGTLHGSTKIAYNQKEKFSKIYKFMEIFKDLNTVKKEKEEKEKEKTELPKIETGFKKFGFVNQHKSADNSPTLKEGKQKEKGDEIVGDGDKNKDKNDPKKATAFIFDKNPAAKTHKDSIESDKIQKKYDAEKSGGKKHKDSFDFEKEKPRKHKESYDNTEQEPKRVHKKSYDGDYYYKKKKNYANTNTESSNQNPTKSKPTQGKKPKYQIEYNIKQENELEKK